MYLQSFAEVGGLYSGFLERTVRLSWFNLEMKTQFVFQKIYCAHLKKKKPFCLCLTSRKFFKSSSGYYQIPNHLKQREKGAFKIQSLSWTSWRNFSTPSPFIRTPLPEGLNDTGCLFLLLCCLVTQNFNKNDQYINYRHLFTLRDES